MTRNRRSLNLSASVRERLRNVAKEIGLDFELVLIRYAVERLLYRLAVSRHGNQFVVKGAMLFVLWEENLYRPTRDVDLLGFGRRDPERLARVFREVCEEEVEKDGLRFPAETVGAETIREEQEYGGVRVKLRALLERARIPMQVDVGFGDAVVPPPTEVEWPSLLSFPRPRLRVYPREATVAEKAETIVRLGIANSRMKDFYDLWWMASRYAFRGETLVQGVAATFQRRRTKVTSKLPQALGQEFFRDRLKGTRWNAFLGKGPLPEAPPPFAEVGEVVGDFLRPVLKAVSSGMLTDMRWPAGGPWESPTTK